MKSLFSFFAADTHISGRGLPNVDASPDTIQDVVNLVFAIMAAVAMLIIVIAGIQFMLARGDTNAVTKARNSIIYAAIGLVVIGLAFSIVTFVINEV